MIYLELHPETGNGKTSGNQHTGQKRETDTVSFSQDTAKKTHQTERTTRRKVSIGEKLGSIANEIKAAGIDDSQKDLTELAKLKDKAPEQVQAVLNMVASESLSVKSAIR